MPHIIVKLYPGRSDEQKSRLAETLARDLSEIADCSLSAVSVSIEEVPPEDWADQVYQKDILDRPETLVRKPGYNPFAEAEKPVQRPSDLMAYVREAAETAALQDGTGMFNPMSWLDDELEENPERFDPCFDLPWADLSDEGRSERMKAIRAVL